MDDPFNGLPNFLAPYIVLTELNQPVSVMKGPFRLVGDADGTLGADLTFRWTPSTAITFNGTYSRAVHSLSDVQWTLHSLGTPVFAVPVAITQLTPGQDSCGLRGILRKAMTLGDGPFGSLRFSLANFPDYLGTHVQYEKDGSRGGAAVRLAVSGPQGNCCVDPIRDADEQRKRARRDAGFVISHVGEWSPSSGTMTIEEAEAVLKMLVFWFGLLRGAWAGPLFPEGLTAGRVVWQQFAAWKVAESRQVETWLPERSPIDLTDLFSGFAARWSESAWRGPIRSAVSWLVEANSSRTSLESKIVIAQVALELLAWVRMVETQKLHSRADFKRLSAAGRLRTLLHHIGITAAIPDYLRNLPALCKGDAFDGPGVITKVRNALVHATDDNRAVIDSLEGSQFLECSQLALQYLELALLAICGYRGKYARRRWRGWKGDDEVLVPWAQG